MGLLDLFKRKPKFKDELFGKLTYTTFKDKKQNFYDGTISFDDQKCGITIHADEEGPTKEQREFFKGLCDVYPSLKNDTLIPFLNKELEDWDDENLIEDFDDEFELDGISLPVIQGKPVHWELTLYSIKIRHFITIDFVDWQPQAGVAVDG